MEYTFLWQTTIAGIAASLACGLGALPLLIRQLNFKKNIGLGYGFAGGLMFSASVYNLLMPGLTLATGDTLISPIVQIIFGFLLGATFCGSPINGFTLIGSRPLRS